MSTLEHATTPSPPASTQVTRMFTRFIAAGFLFYFALLGPKIISQAKSIDLWWNLLSVGLILLPALAFGVLAYQKNLTWVRRLAALVPWTYLLAVWTLPLALNTEGLVKAIWLASIVGLAGLSATLVWKPWGVFTYLIIACTSVQIIKFDTRLDDGTSQLLPDIIHTIIFCAVFAGAGLVAMRTGKILDETTKIAQTRAATSAALQARTVERERFDALTHDGVMSTLLAVSQTNNNAAIAIQARNTLNQLNRLRSGLGTEEMLSISSALSQLRSAATEVDEEILFFTEDDGTNTQLQVPSEVIRSMAAGLSEALRNSLRHAQKSASTPVHRFVKVATSVRQINIQIIDDGKGFSPENIPAHRLGIAVSICGRMQQLIGGSSIVDSVPGKGTIITLQWNSIHHEQ
ncbi:MAG: sensor histidine kinase [Mycobacteriaceae bacterium]